jgi:hypothetical protein
MRSEQARVAPARPPQGLPACSRRLRSVLHRTVGDRAVNLRRIDGAPAGRPHDRGAAAAHPRANPPIRRRYLHAATACAGYRPWDPGILLHSAWEGRRRAAAPGSLPAAAHGCCGAHRCGHPSWARLPACWGDSKSMMWRACADAPALFRYRPAACLANSRALPHATPATCRRGFPAHTPSTSMKSRRIFALCPQISATFEWSALRTADKLWQKGEEGA